MSTLRPPVPPSGADGAELEGRQSSRLRALEDKLGAVTRTESALEEEPPPPSLRDHVSGAAREVVDRIAPVSQAPDASVAEAVRELLSGDYYLRKLGRLGMRNRSEEV